MAKNTGAKLEPRQSITNMKINFLQYRKKKYMKTLFIENLLLKQQI